MIIGTQLLAPSGFKALQSGVVYHFLRSDAVQDRVLLLQFKDGSVPRSVLLTMNRELFERGLLAQLICRSEVQSSLPPWLSTLEGMNLAFLDNYRPAAVKSHSDRVQERLLAIQPLLNRQDEILSSEDPERVINRMAREAGKNEARLRLWFFTYLAFCRNVWALLPPYCRIGHWSRQTHPSETKLGRPSIKRGRHSGYRVDVEMSRKIIESYLQFSEFGMAMTKVYSKAMIKIFGCKVVKDGRGFGMYHHPKGQPFPTLGQYRYVIYRELGREDVQLTLYGETRYRSKLAASQGRYSEVVSNLMERIEADGYYTDDYPTGILADIPLPKISVVRARCATSGMLVGIGFALGAETSLAYRMMLFSMAIPKTVFCRLFGMQISPDDWPSQGLPSMGIDDRGPGSTPNLVKHGWKCPIREMAPSYAGQGKAQVETSHPKQIHKEGAPSYVHSNLNPVEMATREVMRLIRDNHAIDVAERRTPEMIAADFPPSPIGIWDYLSARGRIDAYPMPFDEAVRTFLTQTEFIICADGVYLREQRYDSPALRGTGVLERVATSQRIRCPGYVLDLCVRHVWLELDGRIIELDAQLSIRDDEDQLKLSLLELAQLDELHRKQRAEFKEHVQTATSEFYQRFEEVTGLEADAGKRKTGRAKAALKSSTDGNQHDQTLPLGEAIGMTANVLNPWVTRYLPLLDSDEIRMRACFSPPTIVGLDGLPTQDAVQTIEKALEAIYVPSDYGCDILRRLVERAISHARTNYLEETAFLSNLYAEHDPLASEVRPLCLTGLAGVGKSQLLRALGRILSCR